MQRQFRAATRSQIAGHADFNWNLSFGQLLDQLRILPSHKTVANAFRLKIQRTPDRFRPSAFAGMSREMKPVFRTARVNSREPLRRPRLLVAADSECNHVTIVKLDGEIKHTLRFFGAELPHRIEDPQKRNAEVLLAALAATLQALENRREILLTPKADTDRNNDLCMKHVLCFQPLHQPVSDQLVIFRRAQVSGHILESREEAGEVFVVVELLNVGG